MPNLPPYICPACGASSEEYDSYAAYDAHRTTVHGRRADGTLVLDWRPSPTRDEHPTLERRIAALERTVERLVREMERMQVGSEP